MCTTPKQTDITSSLTNLDGQNNNDHCCKTTCTSIGGTWLQSCGDLTKFDNKALDVTDKVIDNPNGYALCCVPKA